MKRAADVPVFSRLKAPKHPRQWCIISAIKTEAISVKIVRIFIFIEVKRKYLSPDTAKIPLQIFLWLDDLVMSAWLQSQRVSWLAVSVKPAQIPVAGKFPLAEQNCFSVGDYFSWTGFSGLPSYNTDAFISPILHSNGRRGITARTKVIVLFTIQYNWYLSSRLTF